MEGFFFGDQRQPLFGVRHEPLRTAPRATAVLLCPSWGMEYMRSYRTLHLLGEALAQRGFETLRFDYSCTGNSAGYSGAAEVSCWLADIRSAAREIRDLSGACKLCVLGLRVGGLLASRSVADGLAADHVVLWDTPRSGREWLDQLIAHDAALVKHENRYRPLGSRLPPPPPEELLGVPIRDQMRRDLVALQAQLPAGAGRGLQIRSADAAVAALDAETLELADQALWQRADMTGTPWLPMPSITVIADHLQRWLP